MSNILESDDAGEYFYKHGKQHLAVQYVACNQIFNASTSNYANSNYGKANYTYLYANATNNWAANVITIGQDLTNWWSGSNAPYWSLCFIVI